MAIARDYLIRIFQICMFMILLSCCGGDQPVAQDQIKNIRSLDFNYALESVVFNPDQQQNYSEFIYSDNHVSLDTMPAEYRTLLGLAHLYQGEIFQVTSQILAHMQLDIYEGSSDLAHGEKFPINYQNIDHQDEMLIWRGIDASEIYGYNIGRSIFDRIQDINYSEIISILDSYYLNRSDNSIYDNTFLKLGPGREILSNQNQIPSLALQIELEKMYADTNYTELLRRLQDILSADIFPEESEFKYFNSMLFKLASLSHYQLGIETLERSFQDTSIFSDSISFRLITIMNLARQYDSFDQSQKIINLWSSSRDILVSNANLLSLMVKDHQRKPYSLDWMFFLNALYSNIPNFTIPTELAHLIYEDDNIANRIMHYFAEHKDPETLTMTKEIIDQLLNTPSLLDKYPTVVSGFIQDLNLSPLSLEYKTQIQNISELLGFNVAHSNSSWHRNRPGFLISLYGTLRWHGSRLPNCNGFLQDIVGRFPPIVALSHIANLFTQQILNAKSNPKKTINT
ncbi:MAG: hypothetical protein HOM08_12515 [Candidatus Marinimicrobia bacterium]|jgi:hypothetical protein|nr:hypothetical protein [Candidatus Neomarinimicrobiota bacterium]